MNDKSSWVIGGTTLIGIGVGFIFLTKSPLLFVASILIGIGVGLVVASILKKDKWKNKSQKIINIFLWILFLWFLFNIIGNMMSASTLENMLFIPVSAILSLMSLRLALEKHWIFKIEYLLSNIDY